MPKNPISLGMTSIGSIAERLFVHLGIIGAGPSAA